jgi:hypothetical protein
MVSEMSGIIHKVAILGREFTIQTELIPESTIRTLVYDGGRLITKREIPLDEKAITNELVEARVAEQHQRIIDTLLTRAIELQAIKIATAPTTEAPVPATHSTAPKGLPGPKIEPGSPLERAIAVRRTIGPFSLAFGRPMPTEANEQNELLETAQTMIEDIMESPTWEHVRLDEQLTMIALQANLSTWRTGERDPASVPEIWSTIERFAYHLQKINLRKDLVAFDHQLLTWAISELGRGEVSADLVTALDALAGRDVELDSLVARKERPGVHELLESLLGLLDRTLA